MIRIVTRFTASACFVCLILASSISLGEDDTAWDVAQAAFSRGDYSTALAEFETALAEGQSGPAVHYNIGVCQFEIGEFERAAVTFAHISQRYPKMRALAEYNRGLVAVEQDSLQSARQHFLTAYELSASVEKLRILSSTMLHRIESGAGKSSPWVGALRLNAGYDDNIVLRDEIGVPLDVSTESSLVDVFASIRGPIPGLTGLHFDANAYLIWYLDNNDFDQGEVKAGFSYDWTGRRWQARVGINAGYTTFGGDAFDDSRNLDVRMNRALSAYSSLRLRYRYADVSAADPVYAGIDGSRQSYEIAYRWNQDSGRFDASYFFESNDRLDPGVSATRDRLRLRYRYELNPSWTIDAGGDIRVSKFDDLVPERTEDLVALRLGLVWFKRSGWQLSAGYQYSKNTSTDEAFSYTRNQVSIGVLKLF
jgi:tetratricopeptide (TPR) repeat protein